MADYLQPAPARSRARRGYAIAVGAAGALLTVCAILPWAALEARSSLLGGAIAGSVRGVDDSFGVYTLIAGLAALACGLAGALAHPRLAALAVVPGAAAVLVVVLFVIEGSGIKDRFSIDLGDLLSVEPVIRFGWFAALASAVAVVVLSVLALVRRA
ncbi:hypothetical protein [Nonomuraea zeae]|uniref:Uncharacterized protein n=1 Tax=Nonomuraea zeae TaxID=1642303 RepID=A0A5S4G3C1_9ACTN|nr:hypothetical protein [Nonomuraea zeae]TMR27342.1 hypothetical protein ETD85_39510 [Nonomuraea zeae]